MRRVIQIVSLIFIMLLLGTNYSFGAVQIKDDTSAKVITGKSISDCYDISRDMKKDGQGLEGTNVNVKMANNYEWAVVSYFSNSNYGTGGAGENTGSNLGDTGHKTTNGNITGVMDWGKTYTFTAGIISNYTDITDTTSGKSIIEDAGTSAIDKFESTGSSTVENIAKTGWYRALWSCAGANVSYPYSVRTGIFGFYGGTNYDPNYGRNGNRSTGAVENASDITFRPVIYTQ